MDIHEIKKEIAKIFLPILKIWNYFQRKKYGITVLNTLTSLSLIKDNNLSISRFGDGEFDLINGKSLKFQEYTPLISKRLKTILEVKEDIKSLKIAIPCSYMHLSEFNRKSQLFWIMYYKNCRKALYNILNKEYKYFDSQITRIYINRKNYKLSQQYFQLWKEIWHEKDILIVEGEYSRFGVGNDLFKNTKSIKRIICPAENSFAKYEEIFSCIKDNANERLVLLVLGPTATILSFDLAKEGIRSIDIGNMDMEYEWFIRKTTKKIKIQGKYSLEVSDGTIVDNNNDRNYLSQIICKIL